MKLPRSLRRPPRGMTDEETFRVLAGPPHFATGGIVPPEAVKEAFTRLEGGCPVILPPGWTSEFIDWRALEIAPGVTRCPPDRDNDREWARA
jgi:hypothetical protein